MPDSPTNLLAMTALALACSLVPLGCSGPSRAVLTDAQLRERDAVDLAESRETLRTAITHLISRAEREGDKRIDILALSGGGDFGAFGAGFLIGWGAAPSDGARPEFDLVTGVSTGALIAPFAYIGTDEALHKIEDFYRNPKKDWLQSRGLLFFLPWNQSFFSIPGLERDIRAAVNRAFVDRLAEESRQGKVLAVSATDLDFGRQKFWDLGLEAQRATDEAGVERVQAILLASAAIPAVFPPVAVGEGLYADGGVTANLFLRLDDRNPDSLIPRWRAKHPNTPLPPVRFWIIVNNQLAQAPASMQMSWTDVVNPALATAIRSSTNAEIRWLVAEADYMNAVYDTDIEVRVVAIPNDWRAPVKGDFKEETMRSLADLGRELGADPESWQVWTLPVER